MSNEDFENEPEGMKSLRAALDKANKALEEQAKTNAALAAKDRQRSIADKLAEHKINPKVAKFVDPDVELDKLEVWIADNAEVFGFNLQQSNPADDAEAAAQRRISNLSGDPSGDENPDLSAVQEAKSFDDLERIIYAAQAGQR